MGGHPRQAGEGEDRAARGEQGQADAAGVRPDTDTDWNLRQITFIFSFQMVVDLDLSLIFSFPG